MYDMYDHDILDIPEGRRRRDWADGDWYRGTFLGSGMITIRSDLVATKTRESKILHSIKTVWYFITRLVTDFGYASGLGR